MNSMYTVVPEMIQSTNFTICTVAVEGFCCEICYAVS